MLLSVSKVMMMPQEASAKLRNKRLDMLFGRTDAHMDGEGRAEAFDPGQDLVAYIVAAEELDNSDEERRRVGLADVLPAEQQYSA